MRGLFAIALLAGCNQILGVSTITLGDGGGSSHGSDAAQTACIPGTLIRPCFVTMPTDPLTLTGNTINTDTDSRCTSQAQLSGPTVCVIGGSTLTVMQGTLRATGSRPLVLVAVTDLDVKGEIDLIGGGPDIAAGANTGLCLGAGAGGDSANGAGGGGGGAFGSSAGIGGKGSVGAGGGAGGVPALPFVRGGCDGGNGGAGSSGAGGLGGMAGGAIYLVAGGSITIESTASVQASGGGGAVGGAGGGGGGGASGGLIGIDAPDVEVDGGVIASGGGGAGGGAGGMAGRVGTDSSAGGGTATAPDGGGGNGGVGTTTPTNGAMGGSNGGGGGGGGSVGVVWMNYTTGVENGEITPAETNPM